MSQKWGTAKLFGVAALATAGLYLANTALNPPQKAPFPTKAQQKKEHDAHMKMEHELAKRDPNKRDGIGSEKVI
jgi:hypothetical protein